MPTSFKVESKDWGDDDEEDDDEIEVSHWLIAAYPIGTSCFLFQICMSSGLCKTLDCKKCPNGQLNRTDYKRHLCCAGLWKQQASFKREFTMRWTNP